MKISRRFTNLYRFVSLAASTLIGAFLLNACGGGGSNGQDSRGTPPPSVSDQTRPTATISSPTSSDVYTANASSLSLAGTAADDTGVTQVAWNNNRGGSGTASGTSAWSISGISLQNGTNVITVTARDAAGNTGTDSLVVSYGTVATATYYLSPTGSNANNGTTPSTPWRSFAHAFSRMSGGDELILLNGTYSVANGTGVLHWDTSTYSSNSAQPPSGAGLTQPTYIHALNPGGAIIDGPLFIGRSTRKDTYITIQGVTFEGGGQLYNADYVTLKDVGIHGGFSIGTNDHHNGNAYNLIEDVWIWAAGQRIIASNYRAHNNVWRRVVIRGDGCSSAGCIGSGNPNVGITVYDSHDVSLQNVIVIDRILGSGEPYADFAVAQHTPDPRYYFGRAEWLGTLSLNAPDSGYYFEPDTDQVVDPSIRIANAVAWNAADSGFNLARDGRNNTLENLIVFARGGDGIRVAPELATRGGTLRNAIVYGAGRYGVNSAYAPSYMDVYNETYNQTTCQSNCYTLDPTAGTSASLKYLTRVESGSALKGAGYRGGDIGANIVYRYGVDGTRHGDTSYNTLTGVSLWPWPNEGRIKREMCGNTGITRGFCSNGLRLDGSNPVTLTSYIWEYLGNPLPAGIY